MPTADLRALAERLGMLKDCPCGELKLSACDFNDDPVPFDCPSCLGAGQRLPTEAEVRAAIVEAAVHYFEVGATTKWAGVMFGGDDTWRVQAYEGEADPDDLPRLALMRALEAARGN